MHSLALALHLFGAEPALVPDLRIVPPLVLAAEPDGAPDLAPPLPGPGTARELDHPPSENLGSPPTSPTSRERHVRPGAAIGAAAGILVADLAALAALKGAGFPIFQSHADYSGPSTTGPVLGAVGVLGAAFLPPAVGILGARLAGERGEAGGRAYWLAFVCRFVGGAAAGYFVHEGAPSAATATALATELVLQPYVIAWVLAGAPHPTPPPPGVMPEDARPERDPALSPAR